MEVKVMEYQPIDAFDILERNVREFDTNISGYDFENIAHEWKKGGPAFTLVIDNEIVACGGVVIIRPGLGEAWTLLSSLFFKYPKTGFSTTKKKLEEIIKANCLRRVQAYVKPEHNAGEQFMEHLGFIKEGLLRGYGPDGSDFSIFGRVC